MLGTTTAFGGPVLPANHSLQFRVHTRVLVTLTIAFAATAVMWAQPSRRTALLEAVEARESAQPAPAREIGMVSLTLQYPAASSAPTPRN